MGDHRLLILVSSRTMRAYETVRTSGRSSCDITLCVVFFLICTTYKLLTTVDADPCWVLPVIRSFLSFVRRKDPIPDTSICVQGCTGLTRGIIQEDYVIGIQMMGCVSCVMWSG